MSIAIYYEMAAAGFFIVLFFADLVKKQLHTRQTKAFQVLLFSVMLVSIVQMLFPFAQRAGVSGQGSLILEAVTVLLKAIYVFSVHCYVLALVHRLCWKWYYSIHVALFVVLMAALFGSPWNGFCFSYKADGTFAFTGFMYVFFVLLTLLIVGDWCIMWCWAKRMTTKRKVLCSMLLLSMTIMIFGEIHYPMEGNHIMNVVISVFVFAFYLSLQSSDFYVDNATGAYNRNGFCSVLMEHMSYKKPVSCFLIRVRNFSAMNQIYGEEVLRLVQKEMGQKLRKMSDGNRIYHIGASTYAMFLPTKEEVAKLWKNVREKMPTVWTIGDEVVNQEYSFYVVSYPEDGEDYEDLLQRVHYARSDHAGHHKAGALIHLHSESVRESEDKKKVARLIEEAIMDNSLELNYQPIYSLEKGRITSIEVLSRLKDENKKYINPEYFIHVAEENHTIIQLGEQIFRKACSFVSRNHIFDEGVEDININLSPAQCRYEGLTDSFVEIAKEYEVPMSKMHLEITESEFTDAAAVGRTLERIKETGAKVALDDFGTGFSTLSNILELPVDYVKIDKSLVWSFADGKNQFLNDLMPMIKAEGKKIIAEGIENEEHINIIKDLRGDFLQGYYYSKPLPEEQFVRFLKNFNTISKER